MTKPGTITQQIVDRVINADATLLYRTTKSIDALPAVLGLDDLDSADRIRLV